MERDWAVALVECGPGVEKWAAGKARKRRAGLVGCWAAWVGFRPVWFFSSPILFPISNQRNLFEFKFEFEFKPHSIK